MPSLQQPPYTRINGINTIFTYDPASGALGSVVVTGGGPQGFWMPAFTPDGSKLVAADLGQAKAWVIEADDPDTQHTVALSDTFPRGLAVTPGGRYALVGLNRALTSGVDVIDLEASPPAVVATVDTNNLSAGPVICHPDGTRAFLCSLAGSTPFGTSGDVQVIDTSDPDPTNWTAGDHFQLNGGSGNVGPTHIGILPDGSEVWVLCQPDGGGGATMQYFDTATLAVGPNVAIGHNIGGMCVSPDGSKVWVGGSADRRLERIDTATHAVDATVPLGPNASFSSYAPAISADGATVYAVEVTNLNMNNQGEPGGIVYTVDAATLAVTAHGVSGFVVPAPYFGAVRP